MKHQLDADLVLQKQHIPSQAVESLIDIELNDIRMVGIHGLGGIGKTTITKAIYNKIVDNFEGSCFLENVR